MDLNIVLRGLMLKLCFQENYIENKTNYIIEIIL